MSRCKWINYGDRNTSYFQNLATARKWRNRVLMLQDEQGNWVDDQQKLKDMGVTFFSKLYKEDGNQDRFLVSSFFPQLKNDEINALQGQIIDEEITGAIFPMGG